MFFSFFPPLSIRLRARAARLWHMEPMSDHDFKAAVEHACKTGLGLPTPLRFDVGALIMCNLGPDGWKLGRVVALHYREDHWTADQVAPYQVALEGDNSLIYVPHEDSRFCRKATQEDLNIERRLDTLAPSPPGPAGSGQAGPNPLLSRSSTVLGETETERWRHSVSGYRDGRCHGCGCYPDCWSCVELYSEHYRAAVRNGLKITWRTVDLGTVSVGEPLHHPASFPASGFMQCPTLPRLPPGVTWTDDGALSGSPRFDPHRPPSYKVEFVAVSTAEWEDATVGLVRLVITFVIEGNMPPEDFDELAFRREQRMAHMTGDRLLSALAGAWERWELQREAGNRETIDQMCAHLIELRELLERYPRLGGGRFFAQLGGFYMNVHKLLENTLFECELYLGQALLFGDAEVRRHAEQVRCSNPNPITETLAPPPTPTPKPNPNPKPQTPKPQTPNPNPNPKPNPDPDPDPNPTQTQTRTQPQSQPEPRRVLPEAPS